MHDARSRVGGGNPGAVDEHQRATYELLAASPSAKKRLSGEGAPHR